MKVIKYLLNIYTLTFVIVLSILLGLSMYFSVDEIQIDGVVEIKGIERYSGSLLVLIDEVRVAEEIQDVNPALAKVSVFKQYPRTLYITARKSRPIVSVKLADGVIAVNEHGIVLAKNRSSDIGSIPQITYYQPLFFNQFIIGDAVEQAGILASARFAHDLLDLGIGITSIDIANENMIVLLTDDFSVLITSEEDVVQQFEKFSFTYTQLRREGRGFQSIDVRFEKPVIKLEN